MTERERGQLCANNIQSSSIMKEKLYYHCCMGQNHVTIKKNCGLAAEK